jgi:hypothetical protein
MQFNLEQLSRSSPRRQEHPRMAVQLFHWISTAYDLTISERS